MTLWLSAGLIFTFAAMAAILFKWGNLRCIGVTPVRTFTFIAILFTSGLDVGLIMFPLTEFAGYAEPESAYSFTNPLAIEFGFWAFLIWGFYFLTCFYFCVIEPRVKFFEIPLVRLINNLVIIGTCAFTAFLLLKNLPWYLPQLGDGESLIPAFYLIVLASIVISVFSSTSLRYVRVLSLATSWLFIALIAGMWCLAFLTDNGSPLDFLATAGLIGDYFRNLDQFVLPIDDYHAFYLFWWFSWSVMIGQFTARFAGGLRTWQLLGAMLLFPSLAIGTWFSVLYYYHVEALNIGGLLNIAMVIVGVSMVVNSLDSLIRLYSDNLQFTPARLGKPLYVIGNILGMAALTLLFKLEFLQIEWVGALVIALYFGCFAYILRYKRDAVLAISGSPKENRLDFSKIEYAC